MLNVRSRLRLHFAVASLDSYLLQIHKIICNYRRLAVHRQRSACTLIRSLMIAPSVAAQSDAGNKRL